MRACVYACSTCDLEMTATQLQAQETQQKTHCERAAMESELPKQVVSLGLIVGSDLEARFSFLETVRAHLYSDCSVHVGLIGVILLVSFHPL